MTTLRTGSTLVRPLPSTLCEQSPPHITHAVFFEGYGEEQLPNTQPEGDSNFNTSHAGARLLIAIFA